MPEQGWTQLPHEGWCDFGTTHADCCPPDEYDTCSCLTAEVVEAVRHERDLLFDANVAHQLRIGDLVDVLRAVAWLDENPGSDNREPVMERVRAAIADFK